MLTRFDISTWSSNDVINWLSGIVEDNSWVSTDYIINNNVGGKELLLMTAYDLTDLGATKVDLQEKVLEAIESLRYYNSSVVSETLQILILKLASQARSLHRQLVADKEQANRYNGSPGHESKVITLSKEFTDKSSLNKKQRVSLDTLASVSLIVKTIDRITDLLNSKPFIRHGDFRSMKSLLLALSIELTSTAQRDQFVERPNDIIEKSSKALADYCDRIVYGTKDILLVQPFQLEKVAINRKSPDDSIGLSVKSHPNGSGYIIDKIAPLSLAKKTNKLNEGDELLQINQVIVGWAATKVERLLRDSCQDLILMVKKYPNE